jgi:hypothetical protein
MSCAMFPAPAPQCGILRGRSVQYEYVDGNPLPSLAGRSGSFFVFPPKVYHTRFPAEAPCPTRVITTSTHRHRATRAAPVALARTCSAVPRIAHPDTNGSRDIARRGRKPRRFFSRGANFVVYCGARRQRNAHAPGKQCVGWCIRCVAYE